MVCVLYCSRKEGRNVMGKLHVTERRTKILEYIVFHKQTTRKELAEHFGVCINTIVNDIDVISISAPIYTKQGNGGGIYILPEYRSYKNYLTDTEEELLYNLQNKRCMQPSVFGKYIAPQFNMQLLINKAKQ